MPRKNDEFSAWHYLGTRVCISGATARRCPNFRGRPVGLLQLKGKTTAIEAFEPLLSAGLDASAARGYLDAYRLLEQEDNDVENAFASLAHRHPEDGLVRFHLQRLRIGERGSTIVLKTK